MTEIKKCKTCEGTGIIETRGTRVEPDSSEDCTKCAGTGRIVRFSFSYDVPYIPDKVNLMSVDVDEKIHGILRIAIVKHFKHN